MKAVPLVEHRMTDAQRVRDRARRGAEVVARESPLRKREHVLAGEFERVRSAVLRADGKVREDVFLHTSGGGSHGCRRIRASSVELHADLVFEVVEVDFEPAVNRVCANVYPDVVLPKGMRERRGGVAQCQTQTQENDAANGGR